MCNYRFVFNYLLYNILKALNITSTPDFITGEIIIFDKPLTWTSFNLVSKVRHFIIKKLKIKKLKVGHAGTLDPLATGLLIIATGKCTKLIEQIQAGEKVYEATIFLGATTPSYDLEKEIDKTFDISGITEDMVIATLEKMKGKSLQSPPLFSALRVNGKRAYELARKGDTTELEKREITISDIKILDISLQLIKVEITCSKGTYIRSFANDFGKLLNNGAYLHALRRTKSGDFSIENAFTIEQFEEFVKNSL